MVRVLGNSSERVVLHDLKDVIYYRQTKEYSDQEYETSRDLQRALAQNRLILLERQNSIRGSVERVTGGVDVGQEIRAALREMMPSQPDVDVKSVAREIAPVVAEIVRQELSRLPVQVATGSGNVPAAGVSSFIGPEYVPTVTTEGMVSNVEAKTTETSSEGTEDALAILRRMKQQ